MFTKTNFNIFTFYKIENVTVWNGLDQWYIRIYIKSRSGSNCNPPRLYTNVAPHAWNMAGWVRRLVSLLAARLRTTSWPRPWKEVGPRQVSQPTASRLEDRSRITRLATGWKRRDEITVNLFGGQTVNKLRNLKKWSSLHCSGKGTWTFVLLSLPC